MLLLFDDAPAPTFDAKFLAGTLPAGLTYTNSSTVRTYFGADGLLKTAAANGPVFEYDPVTRVLLGMRWEMEQRTNLCLWNRDLTNAAWVSTNGTTLKNQTGIDGVTNSASSFTATAGNATCLQSITSASAARVTSFFLKRITGTGTVNITQDNGTTWTAVTLTASWQRFQVTSTVTNPVIGIRVVTSGDSVALDYAQHESGASTASSPIPTTSAAVIRQPDVLTATSISPWYNQSEGTVVFEGIRSGLESTGGGLYCLDDGTINERMLTEYVTSGATFRVVDGGVNQALITSTGTAANTVFRSVSAYKINSFASCLSGGAVTIDASGTIPTITALRMGVVSFALTSPFMGYARRFQYFNTSLKNQIQGMSRV